MDYCLSITCLDCGAEVQHVNGTPTGGQHVVAIVECVACGHQWMVDVKLARHAVPKSKEAKAHAAHA